MASTRSSRVPHEGNAGWEKALETVVWETPGLAGEGAQGGPAGAVVEVVQGEDQVAMRTGWEVGSGERAHRPDLAVAAMASESGTCWCASVAARLSSRAATVPWSSRRAHCAARHRQ